ncbi:MAG TPA: hypothetical protein VIV09_13260, partial [Pseudolabrys sp.]
MDKFIKDLSDRNPLREYDEVLVNMWGGWELFKDLRRLQNYPKWPYQCEIHRLDGGVGTVDAESSLLANKDDPHSLKVFDPSIKGETDRFAYRFVKL